MTIFVAIKFAIFATYAGYVIAVHKQTGFKLNACQVPFIKPMVLVHALSSKVGFVF